MKSAHSRAGEFRRVGENLCRYSSNGVYYARFRINGKLIQRSLDTTDREMARRRLAEEVGKANKVEQKLAGLTLDELLKHYEERLSQYAAKTVATRKCILKIFKGTWKSDLNLPVKRISTGQLEMWLAARRQKMRNATYNEYARFVRHVFDLAVKLRVLPSSPDIPSQFSRNFCRCWSVSRQKAKLCPVSRYFEFMIPKRHWLRPASG